MKKVLLIHTGGTLGMRGRRPHALRPGAFFKTLKDRVPELGGLAHLTLELFSNIDSSEMQPHDWSALATCVHDRIAGFDGVVITHGTDTLAWTASALSFMLPGLPKPVVLTGAQRPLAEVRSDARLNLIDAVTAALNGPREVTVCFDSHLYRGNRVRKVSSGEFDAFDSPNCAPLGVLGVETRFEKGLQSRSPFKLEESVDPRVFLLKVFPGLDPLAVLPTLKSVRGLVVEAHGSGNFPVRGSGSLLPVFREARRLKLPVVVISQAERNGVDLSLYEAGRAALDEGALSGGDMTSSAAVVKLMHALARVTNASALRAYMSRNIAGENPPERPGVYALFGVSTGLDSQMTMSEDKTSVHTIADLLGKGKGQAAYLIVISAKSPAAIGRMLKLDKAETVMGRSAEASLQIEDDGVSRKHAKVLLSPQGHFQLMDLGSTNGTYLNGIKVNVATLADGDKIQIGSNTVLKFSIQDQLEEQYQRSIYESATRDGLTRIFNKKYFMDTLRKEFAYCLRHRVPMSLVMFDVDHFKKINDTYGHPAGDYCLARIAQKVMETVRQEDLFARYGGEEFSLMLRESAVDKALRCAERCRKAVDSADFTFNGTPIKVTISLGVATLFDSDFSQPEDIIAAADKYLYRAKRGGRNRVDAMQISGP